MWVLDKLLGGMLREGQMTVTYADGTKKTYGVPGTGRQVGIRIMDRRVVREIVRNPRLGFGEAFIDGRLTIDNGDILDFLDFVTTNVRWERGGGGRKALKRGGNKLINRWRRLNWESRSKRNVAHHYDLSDRLYDLFLDEDRQYSCAYFTDPGNSLDQAQSDKKAHIAAKLYLKPGQRVLDIGSGWGGMALYLNRIADVDVLGITLSEEQIKVARRRAEEAGVADRVKFELTDYRKVTGRFDRIVSVGMFEHVGPTHYAAFFRKCRELLAEDGVMLLHTIGKLGPAGSGTGDPFTHKYVFPGYYLPALSEMCRASEPSRMIVADVENLRLHYAHTLRHWLARTRAAREEIVALYEERFFRLWEFYLAGGITMFENGSGCVYQIQYIRDRYTLPITRDYMIEAEGRLRAQE
ncbi:MAG TPA: cyclopropane-fatty-acyl-phospholipid synthase family protein [Allosphingosinicella sp.]|nr:cyclopropane-fatty-acyl-phospholipid synthase family protein [Allosphingosinicella sp.]